MFHVKPLYFYHDHNRDSRKAANTTPSPGEMTTIEPAMSASNFGGNCQVDWMLTKTRYLSNTQDFPNNQVFQRKDMDTTKDMTQENSLHP